jgi:predicted AAA+ superfamily ATPase
VVSEIRKAFLHYGEQPPLYFWRDSNGNEVDIIIDKGATRVPIEAKSGETVAADMFKNLDKYIGLSGDAGGILVHGGDACYTYGRHSLRGWGRVA